jgi:hypothetical protein
LPISGSAAASATDVRGCLFIVILAGVVVAGAAWFGSAPLASALISAALENAGYHAERSTVRATADLPPRLLLGQADRVEIVGAGVDFRTFHAASLDLVLTKVDLLARTAATISGEIDGAELKTSTGSATTADVVVDGPASAAEASITVSGETVDRIVRETFQREFGIDVDHVTLEAPDLLRITAPGATLEGRLAIDPPGDIVLRTGLGTATILSLDPSFPLELRSVRAIDGDLRVEGVLDADELLGGR